VTVACYAVAIMLGGRELTEIAEIAAPARRPHEKLHAGAARENRAANEKEIGRRQILRIYGRKRRHVDENKKRHARHDQHPGYERHHIAHVRDRMSCPVPSTVVSTKATAPNASKGRNTNS